MTKEELEKLYFGSTKLCEQYLSTLRETLDEAQKWKSLAEELANALLKCRGPLTYAYEDSADIYYDNAMADILAALEKFNKAVGKINSQEGGG